MLRHLLRFAILLTVLGAAALAGAALLNRTEPVTIEWSGWILSTHLWVVVAAAIVALVAGWLIIALLLSAIRAPRSIRHAVHTRRRERGLLALGQAFSAITAEDGKAALSSARRAERLLGDARVTRPLVAKSLEMSGLAREAKEYFSALAASRDTAESGVRGLLSAAKREGDADTAIDQARQVVALHPSDPAAHRELFDLSARQRKWHEAREALPAAVRHGAYRKEEARQLEAVAYGGEAEEAHELHDLGRARECAQRAAELAPSLSAPACLAARLLARKGERKRAERLLLAAWRAEPVPELAATWSALEPPPAAGRACSKASAPACRREPIAPGIAVDFCRDCCDRARLEYRQGGSRRFAAGGADRPGLCSDGRDREGRKRQYRSGADLARPRPRRAAGQLLDLRRLRLHSWEMGGRLPRMLQLCFDRAKKGFARQRTCRGVVNRSAHRGQAFGSNIGTWPLIGSLGSWRIGGDAP